MEKPTPMMKENPEISLNLFFFVRNENDLEALKRRDRSVIWMSDFINMNHKAFANEMY